MMKDSYKKESPLPTLVSFGGGSSGFLYSASSGEPYWWLGYSGQYSGTWGGTRPTAIDIDSDGNIYVFGHSRAVVSSTSAEETFLIKLDKYGTLVWERGIYVNNNSTEGYGMRVASSGNIYISGTCYYNSGYPNGPSGDSIFTAKYNNSGTLQWMRCFGSSGGDDVGRRLTIDSSENVYVTGHMMRDANGNTGGYENAVAIKYNSSGTIQWKRYMGRTGSYHDLGECIVVDSGGNYYVSGEVEGGSDGRDIFLTKSRQSDHYLIWNKRFSLSSNTTYSTSPGTQGMAIDSNDNIYLVGRTYLHTQYIYRGWIIKVNSSGNILWDKALGASYRDVEFMDVTVDGSDNVYITGTAAMEYTNTNNQNYTDFKGDVFIAKFDSAGTEQWKIGIGVNSYGYNLPMSNRAEFGMAIKVDDTGNNVYVAGISCGMDPRAITGLPSWNTLQANGVVIKIPGDGGATLTGSYDPSGTFGNTYNGNIVTYGGGKAGGSALTTLYNFYSPSFNNDLAHMGYSTLANYTGNVDITSTVVNLTASTSPVIGLSTSGPYPIDEGESGITGFSTSWNPSIPS